METTARLRDGSEVLIRRLEPSDASTLSDAFERLSKESRDLRFLSAKPALTERDLDYLTHVDGHFHEALGATDRSSGVGVGVTRFVRAAPAATTAEVAVTVVDEWQGRGLGKVLLDMLAVRAREEGIARLTALVATGNAPIRSLLQRLGSRVSETDAGFGTIAYEIELP